MTSHSLNYAAAASFYAARNHDGIFPFHLPFPSPMTFNFDNYYVPSPYYPHLTESLNLKINQNIYKPSNLFTPSSYDFGIGKVLSSSADEQVQQSESNQLQPPLKIQVKKVETMKVADKENEVTSSEEIPSNLVIKSTTQSLTDSAMKLLFLTIRWIKSISSFNQFSSSEQKRLVMHSWPELFVLSAAQWGFAIDTDTIAPPTGFLRNFQNLVKHFNAIKIDQFESTCMKALILFRGDNFSDENFNQRLQSLQNQSLCLLIEKCGTLRFGHLMLFITQIKNVGNVNDLQENLLKFASGEDFVDKILDEF